MTPTVEGAEQGQGRHEWIEKREGAGLPWVGVVRGVSRIVVRPEASGRALEVDCSALYPADTLFPTTFLLEPDSEKDGFWVNPMVDGSAPLSEHLLGVALMTVKDAGRPLKTGADVAAELDRRGVKCASEEIPS